MENLKYAPSQGRLVFSTSFNFSLATITLHFLNGEINGVFLLENNKLWLCTRTFKSTQRRPYRRNALSAKRSRSTRFTDHFMKNGYINSSNIMKKNLPILTKITKITWSILRSVHMRAFASSKHQGTGIKLVQRFQKEYIYLWMESLLIWEHKWFEDGEEKWSKNWGCYKLLSGRISKKLMMSYLSIHLKPRKLREQLRWRNSE